jgi:two-component system, chemotaxis family, chemotaxis protein CheY
LRILIVDDSPVIRLLLMRILKDYGECASARDGLEAIDTYRRSLNENLPFDLICLDLGLPGIHGVDVLREVRALHAQSGSLLKPRVLVITASSELSEVEAVIQLGADGYLVKPLVKQRLFEYLTAFGFQGVTGRSGPL